MKCFHLSCSSNKANVSVKCIFDIERSTEAVNFGEKFENVNENYSILPAFLDKLYPKNMHEASHSFQSSK